MKILHIITSLNIGGAEKLMVDLLPRLKQRGAEVELLVFVGNRTMFYDQLACEGIKITAFAENGSVYNPLHIIRLCRFLKKNKFDVVHTHNTAPQLFAALVAVLCSVVLVTTEHTTSNRRRDWKWYRLIDKWMYSKYSRVICISDATEKNLREYLSCDAIDQKYLTVYNGVDVDKYADALPFTDYHTSRKVVTMVAGFRYQKDQDTLIRAMQYLPQAEYELWLVGDGERRGELETLVTTLGLNDQVKFWGIRGDVPSLLKRSDVVVLSSHWEGFGLATVEGMSVGKPFIASDVDGLNDVTRDAGLLFTHGDDKQLAELIQTLMRDRELYKYVASQCLQRAKQYDISKMVDGYMNVYKELTMHV